MWSKNVQTRFIVDEHKKVVICLLETENDVWSRFRMYGVEGMGLGKYALENKLFRGVARCSPDDEWDEEYGKRLAEYRAQQKRAKYVNKTIEKETAMMQKRLFSVLFYGMMREPTPPIAEMGSPHE